MPVCLRLSVVILIFFLAGACGRRTGNGGPLLFWCSNNPREIAMCDSLTEEWNRSHGAHGVQGTEAIHLQPIPEGQSSEEVILAAVVGKTTPDIYANMWQGNVEMFAAAGVLVPLDTLAGFLSFIHERCDSAVIKEITSADGHIYQVPWKVNPIMTIYNKDLFARNGIDALPRTYSAYQRAAATCKKNGVKWFGYTEVKEIWYQRLFNFYPLYLAASGGAPLILHNRAAFNNKYAVEVFAFLQSLYRDGYFSRENLSAADDPFAGQAIATKWTGPWEIPYLDGLSDRNFAFDWFEPQVPDDHQGPVYTYADPKNIVVFSTCTRPQAAWDFIRTLVDKRGDLQLLAVTGQLPRRQELLSDPYYSDYFKRNPMMASFARELPFVKGVDNCEVIVEVLDILSQEYEACVVYGKKEPATAIRDAERAVNILLASNTKRGAK